MALKLGTLFFDFDADTSKLKRKQKEIVATNQRVSRSFKVLGAAISAAFAADGLRRAALLADTMELLDVRIRNATRSQREFVRTQRELLRISSQTGTALADNVRLFEAFTIAANELGATNQQVVQFTESINKLGIVGGTSQEALSNATLQLSQALAGGIVRAEEFNSILENTPLIANTLAQSLGVTIGELRKMVIEGRLLSRDVFNAILGQTEDINKRFETFPLTIERASSAFNTAFGQAIKDLDQITNLSDIVALNIQRAADTLLFDFKPALLSVVRNFEKLFLNIATGTQLAKLAIIDFFQIGDTDVTKRLEEIRERHRLILGGIQNDISRLVSGRTQPTTVNIRRGNDQLAPTPGGIPPTVTDIQKIEEELGNETQAIINAMIERNKKIFDITKIGEDERRALLVRSSELAARQIDELEHQRQQTSLARLSDFNNNFLDLLRQGGKDSTALAKALFLANKAIQVSQIIAATEVAAANAAAVSAIGGPASFIATQGFIRAVGYANAGIVAGLGVGQALRGPGRLNGGPAFAGFATPITEDGNPEIFRQGSRQFLLPGSRGGMVETLDQASGGGMPRIVINNNAAGVDVNVGSVTMEQVEIRVQRAEDNAVRRVDTSLSQGRGSTANALQSRFKVERNVR